MKSKTTLLLPLILLSCASVVQFNEDEHLVEIYEDLNDSQNGLFLKANSWMISTFSNAESVIQHSDKEDGVIMGKYLMAGSLSSSMYGTADSRVYAVIDIRVRDNKARIEIRPQEKWTYGGGTFYNFSKDDAKREMARLAESFHSALLKAGIEFQ